MADPLTIDFSLTGADKITAFFGKLSTLSGKADHNLQAVKGSADAAAHSYKALNAEAEKYNRRMGKGGQSQAINIGRGQQLATAGPKGFGDKLADVLKTSRFSVGKGGGDLMPLAGKVAGLAAEALGPEVMALAGPVGLVAGLLAGAATGLKSLADASASAGAVFNQQSMTLGSDAQTTGKLANIGGVDTVSQAETYNKAISGGGMGQLAGLYDGEQNIDNPMFDKLDRGKQYWDMLEHRRKMSPEMQMRQARATGTEASLPLMTMPAPQFDLMKKQGMEESKIMAGTGGQSVAYEQANFGAAKSAEALNTALGKPWVKLFGGLENGVAGANLSLAQGAEWINQHLFGMGGTDKSAVAPDGKAKPLDDNTAALNRLTDQIPQRPSSDFLPGTYGDADTQGRRAAALPGFAGYGAINDWREMYVGSTFRLGAFA